MIASEHYLVLILIISVILNLVHLVIMLTSIIFFRCHILLVCIPSYVYNLSFPYTKKLVSFGTVGMTNPEAVRGYIV